MLFKKKKGYRGIMEKIRAVGLYAYILLKICLISVFFLNSFRVPKQIHSISTYKV